MWTIVCHLLSTDFEKFGNHWYKQFKNQQYISFAYKKNIKVVIYITNKNINSYLKSLFSTLLHFKITLFLHHPTYYVLE